jgi:neutral ceramidase
MVRLIRRTFFLVLAVAGTTQLSAQQTAWRVGLAQTEITPEQPMLMDGYAGRRQPFEGVESPIHTKALALADASGNRALLVTADLLGFSNGLSERIARRLETSSGLPREAILFNASHNHAGPMVMSYPGAAVPGNERENVERYVRWLEDRIVGISERALAEMSEARISWGMGVAPFVFNRREFTAKGVILGLNPRGPADRGVPVLRVEDSAGKLRAVVFGAACHCVSLTQKNRKILGDYAGYAQDYVQRRHAGVQAMFVTGCGGDASPFPRGTLESAQLHGATLGSEVCRLLESPLAPVNGPLRTMFRRVDLPLQQFSKAQIETMAQGAPDYRRFFTDLALGMLQRGEPLPRTYNAPFALWQFGNDLTLVGYSGETLVDYVAIAEMTLGPRNLWVAGYCNDVFGYLPTARVINEGGYETRGLYTGVGLFDPTVEHVVQKTVREMGVAAGRIEKTEATK